MASLNQRILAGIAKAMHAMRRSKQQFQRHEVRPLVYQARQEIDEAMPALERLFIDVSDQMTTLYTNCQDMVVQCEHLREIASGKINGYTLMQEIVSILHEPLEYIDFCIKRQTHLLQLLKRCEDQTLSMMNVRARMQDTLAPLTFMTVLFKIESALLSEDQRATFLNVATEMEALRTRVSETFERNAVLLANTHATLSSVRTRLTIDFERHTRFVAEKRSHVDKAINSLDQQLTVNMERDTRLHQVSKALSQQAGSIVTGLQFQDIIKQKCEHVLVSLDEIDSHKNDTGMLAALNTCHLETVEEDLENGLHSVLHGIDSIGNQVTDLENTTLSQDNVSGMTASVDGMVQLLLDTTNDVREIIRVVSDLTEQAHTAIRPAGDIAKQLTTALDELATSMRLIAINAQVRASVCKEGTGLEQLAAHAADISNDVSKISRATTTELDILQITIDELMKDFSEFHAQGQDQLGKIDLSRPKAEARLHAHRDESIAAIHLIGTGIDSIQSASDTLRKDLEEAPLIKAKVTRAAETLRKIHSQLGSSPSTGNSLKAHAARYTMASEHKVHAALTGERRHTEEHSDPEFFDSIPQSPSLQMPAAKSEKPKAIAEKPAAPTDGVEFF